MSTPVFAHGNLRLYLLSLLEEHPRHGYELIQALSERFGGTYSPSAGTIYPRLSKLEQEGLVQKIADGRKTVYEITKEGTIELDNRRSELHAIENEVTDSVSRMAQGVRAEVNEAMRSLRAELASAAREARHSATTNASAKTHRHDAAHLVREADLAMVEFRRSVGVTLRRNMRTGAVTNDTVELLRSRLEALRTEVIESLTRR